VARSVSHRLSTRRPGLYPGWHRVVFVVHRVALGHVSLWVLRFPLSIIPQCSVLMHSTTRCFYQKAGRELPNKQCPFGNRSMFDTKYSQQSTSRYLICPSQCSFFQPTLTRRTRGHCLGIGNLRSSISVMSVLVSTLKWWNIKYMSVYLCSCWMSSEMQANLPQIMWGCFGDYGAMYFLRRLLYREDGGSMRLRNWVTPCHTVR